MRNYFIWALFFGTSAVAQTPPSLETAITCIKHFEGWHNAREYPYVGYGHRLRSEEKFMLPLSEAQGDSLLRSDLRKKCAVFRRFGKDSLLLATLAYNVGEYRLLGKGKYPKSRLIRKLESGDRNIREEYLSFRLYHGKVVKSMEERRLREFELLFIPVNQKENETKYMRTNSSFSGTKTNGVGRTGRIPGIYRGRSCFIRTQGEGLHGTSRRGLPK
jgi:lysozyme